MAMSADRDFSGGDVGFAPKATVGRQNAIGRLWANECILHCGETASHFAVGPASAFGVPVVPIGVRMSCLSFDEA